VPSKELISLVGKAIGVENFALAAEGKKTRADFPAFLDFHSCPQRVLT
jgi:hypothetical protein